MAITSRNFVWTSTLMSPPDFGRRGFDPNAVSPGGFVGRWNNEAQSQVTCWYHVISLERSDEGTMLCGRATLDCIVITVLEVRCRWYMSWGDQWCCVASHGRWWRRSPVVILYISQQTTSVRLSVPVCLCITVTACILAFLQRDDNRYPDCRYTGMAGDRENCWVSVHQWLRNILDDVC